MKTLIVILTALAFACSPTTENIEFPKTTRTWIGPDFWANRLQDWKINNGELECHFQGANRNLYFLTKEIEKNKDFTLSFDFTISDSEKSQKNYIAFRTGIKGGFNDYRDNAVRGRGMDFGVALNGGLVISNVLVDTLSTENISKGSLELTFTPTNENYTKLKLTLSSNGEKREVTLDTLSKESVMGGLALVSHFPVSKERNQTAVKFSNISLSGSAVVHKPKQAYGPILFNQFTLSRGKLNYTAQMAPIGEDDDQEVSFEIKENGKWKEISKTGIDKMARTARFSIEDWNPSKDVDYRLVYNYLTYNNEKKSQYFEGVIKKDPTDKKDLVVAAFTGNNDLGFPNKDLTDNVKKQNPDFLFFSGDQIYEGVGGYGAQRNPVDKATLDYLRKWYIFGWTYADILKSTPAVSIPDDHDVYHGNIWGANGIAVPEGTTGFRAQDAGGYKMPAEWVNMVQRTQTSHLPNPYDPTPVEQGITVYYTDMVYGGVSFAIIEDRKFKSAPKGLLPEAKVNNGWAQNYEWNAKTDGDPEGAKLLGERQKEFLRHWVTDWSYNAQMKTVLSQTIFANVATLPEEEHHDSVVPKLRILNADEYPPNDRPVSDMDSNGWPKTPRDEALKIIRKAFAFHIAGDQHLGSTIQYGVEEYGDGPYAICVPSVSNVWPRRWYPQEPSENPIKGAPKYAGDFEDGFGNKITVLAVSNPLFTGRKPSNLYDRATGYGIIRFNTEDRKIKAECWTRDGDPSMGVNGMYNGWPLEISQLDNYSREPVNYLPEFLVEGADNPVINIYDGSNDLVYSLRIKGKKFRPHVFANQPHRVEIIDTKTKKIRTIKNLTPGKASENIKINLND